MISSQFEEPTVHLYRNLQHMYADEHTGEKRNNIWKYGRNGYHGESSKIIQTNQRQKHLHYI